MSTLYTLQTGAKPDTVKVTPAWSVANGAPGGLATGYTQIVSTALGTGAKAFLLGYNAASGALDFYALAGTAAKLSVKSAGTTPLGTGWDIVQPFTIGGGPALLAYAASSGLFSFWSIAGPAQLKPLGTFPSTGAVTGFTTVQPLVYRTIPYLLGYNLATGTVCTYQLGKTTAGPLAVQSLGTWTWAKGWTRFGFFQAVGEWCFIKTNLVYKKVFLDHLWDDPATYPSHPVCETFPLSQKLQALVTFELDHFAGYVSYLPNGAATVARIWGDGTGATTLATAKLPPKATLVVSLALPVAPCVLAYA